MFDGLVGWWSVGVTNAKGISLNQNRRKFVITKDRKVSFGKYQYDLVPTTDRQELFPSYWGWFKFTHQDHQRYLALNVDGTLTILRFNEVKVSDKNKYLGEGHFAAYEVGKRSKVNLLVRGGGQQWKLPCFQNLKSRPMFLES